MKYIKCCKDCTRRYAACHDTCERYKQEHRHIGVEAEYYIR